MLLTFYHFFKIVCAGLQVKRETKVFFRKCFFSSLQSSWCDLGSFEFVRKTNRIPTICRIIYLEWLDSWNWCQLGRNWFEKIEKRETNSNQLCPTNANDKVQFWPGQHIILKLASQKKTSVLWWYWVDIKVVERCYCFNYDVDYQQADEHQMLLSKFEVWAGLPPVSVNSQQTSAMGDLSIAIAQNTFTIWTLLHF